MKYIFEIPIKEGYTAEDYAEAWLRASELIQRAPGACGTELHRMIGGSGQAHRYCAMGKQGQPGCDGITAQS
jgi:sugar (pentulose or hexulose) kinase